MYRTSLTVKSNTAYKKNVWFANFLEAREAEHIAADRLMTARLKALTHPTKENIDKATFEAQWHANILNIYMRALQSTEPQVAVQMLPKLRYVFYP